MGSQWSRDKVYVRALKEGYRSRAAYKLREIQEQYHIIRETDNIVDLGASPGSWLQVERELTAGVVVGIDLSYIPPIDNVITIMGDFTHAHTLEEVRPLMPCHQRCVIRCLTKIIRPEDIRPGKGNRTRRECPVIRRENLKTWR